MIDLLHGADQVNCSARNYSSYTCCLLILYTKSSGIFFLGGTLWLDSSWLV